MNRPRLFPEPTTIPSGTSQSLGVALLIACAPLPGMGAESLSSSNASAGLVNDWLHQDFPAAGNWDIGGEARARYDVKENAGSFPNRDFVGSGQDNDNRYLLLRQKVHVGWKKDWFGLFLEARNSSTIADKRIPSPDTDYFDLHQAFLTLGNPQEFPLTLKVGRQQMSYGDERFVENGEWGNLMRAFDAVKVRYEAKEFWVDGFMSHPVFPNNGKFNWDNNYDTFSGVYASTRSLIPRQETELYFFSHNVSPGSSAIVNTSGTGPTSRDVYTLGTRLKSLPDKFGGWDYGVEVAGQLGSVSQTGKRLEQQAVVAFASGGYTWKEAFGQPRLGLDYCFGSGDGNPNDGKRGTFDLLFGSMHKFYGLMDVTGSRNMQTPSVSLTLKPVQNLTVKTEFLSYWLADTHDLFYNENASRTVNGYGIHPEYGSFVGNEIDLLINYAVHSWLNIQCGYAHFIVGEYIRQSVTSVVSNGNAVDADWAYLQVKLGF